MLDEMIRSFGSLEALEAEWHGWLSSGVLESRPRPVGPEANAGAHPDHPVQPAVFSNGG